LIFLTLIILIRRIIKVGVNNQSDKYLELDGVHFCKQTQTSCQGLWFGGMARCGWPPTGCCRSFPLTPCMHNNRGTFLIENNFSNS
jgi:hypothetical protein